MIKTTVQQQASLHEKAVQAVARNEIKKYSRPPTHARTLATYNRNIKVDIRVWRTAMKLAHGDKSRIKVIHETEVIVS